MSKLPALWGVHITFWGRPISLGLSLSLLPSWWGISCDSLCPQCPRCISTGELVWHILIKRKPQIDISWNVWNIITSSRLLCSTLIIPHLHPRFLCEQFYPQCFVLPLGNLQLWPLLRAPWSLAHHSLLSVVFYHVFWGSSVLPGGSITLLALLLGTFLLDALKLFTSLSPRHCSDTPVLRSDY